MKLACIIILIAFIMTVPHHVSADGRSTGLMQNESDAFDGYTLFTPQGDTSTYLIDNNGMIVHSWISDYPQNYSAYLLENGNLLRTANFDDFTIGGFQELSWSGSVIWEYECFGNHHDIEPLPNGNVLLITETFMTETEAIEAGRDPELLGDVQLLTFNRILSRDDIAALPKGNHLWMLRIIEVQKTGINSGTVVWEWNLSDHLIQDHNVDKANFGIVTQHPELININYSYDANPDWIHANSIDYNPEFDQIMISALFFSEVWIIDHSTTTVEAAQHTGGLRGMGGDIIYRWGNPAAYNTGDIDDQRLFMQHDAHWIGHGLPGEGNILAFNNGTHRDFLQNVTGNGEQYSSIEEILPLEEDGNYIVPTDGKAYQPEKSLWKYTSDNPQDFFSFIEGSSQRLPNGNTLICYATKGTIFEVNPQAEKVWEYINPIDSPYPPNQILQLMMNNMVYNCHKYSREYPGLTGKDLSQKGTLESYSSTSNSTITHGNGGSIVSPGIGTFIYGNGQIVTISAEPEQGYEFDRWIVQSGSADIHHPQNAWTTFTMGNRDSVIRAQFTERTREQSAFSTEWIIVIALLVIASIITIFGALWIKTGKRRISS